MLILLQGIIAIVLGVMVIDTMFSPFCILSHYDRGAKMKFYTMFWGILAPVSVLPVCAPIFGSDAHALAGVFAALGWWSHCSWQHLARHV